LKDETSLMSYVLPIVYGNEKNKRKKMLMAGKFIIAILKHPEKIIATSKKYFEGDDDTKVFEIVEHTEKSLRGPNSFNSLVYNEGTVDGLHLLFKEKLFKKQAESIDKATGYFEEALTKTAFSTNNLHTKTAWDEVKIKTDEPRYRMMGEISQLKTMCQSNEETLYRFSLDGPDTELPFKDEGASFAFVFAVDNENSDSVSKMVRSVSYMFSDQAQEEDTQTIEECFEWAEKHKSSEIRDLTYKQKKENRLYFVSISSNAAVTRRGDGFCKYFREGILHWRAYKTNSQGYVNKSGELVYGPVKNEYETSSESRQSAIC